MSLDFYLSEMAVSDLHGGGLTLQRVLGEDLKSIDAFIHVHRFAEEMPIIESLSHGKLSVVSRLNSDEARKRIGCRPSAWLNGLSISQSFHARRVADAVDRRFQSSARPLRALICPQGVESLYATEEISRRRPLHYISWIMDDHLLQRHRNRWVYKRNVRGLLGRHLKNAKARFAISPALADFYSQEFGVSCTTLFGPADADQMEPRSRMGSPNGLKLAYFGAIGDWQTDALVLLKKHLTANRAELDLYSGCTQLPEGLVGEGVVLKERISPSQVSDCMDGYDAVLLPISFREEVRNMSEFNVATKMSECLASGVPTVVIGPEYSAMVRMLEGAGVAAVIKSGSDGEVAKAFSMLADPRWRAETSLAAFEYVRQNASTIVMQRRWKAAVNSVAF